jgi:hypothetical protein
LNTFCPFLKDACRTDCVFRVRETSADEETITVCRLVSSVAINSDLCDIIIKEKSSENER